MSMTDQFDPIRGYDLKTIKKHWHGTLADLCDCLTATFERMRPAPSEPRRLAEVVVLSISEYVGGRAVYLPRGDKLKIALRNDLIYRDYKKGIGIRDLVGMYRLTEQSIYKIISDQRTIRREKLSQVEPGCDT